MKVIYMACMDGLIDREREGWMDGWMNGRMNG